MGKKDDPIQPTAPDPVATAAAQAKTNTAAAITQANLNRIDQYTPQGSLTYTTNGTNEDGTPRYVQTQNLSPAEQAKYDQQNKIALALSGVAGDQIDRVKGAMGTSLNLSGVNGITSNVDGGPIQANLDYSKLAALPGIGDFGAEQKRQSDAVYAQAASRLDPQWQQNDDHLKAQLAAQGISENSDAYRQAYDNEARARTDAYNQANYSAIQAGSQEQSRLFGLAMGARQQGQNEVDTQGTFANTAQGQKFGQGISNATLGNQARQQQYQERAYERSVPLNDIAALLGTGPGVAQPDFSPVSQVGVAAPDYAGMVQSQYSSQMSAYNAQQAAKAQMLGSIFGAAGSLGGAAIKASDIRFKENIKRIGTLANGLATYAYNYIGDTAQQFGVMAQEALRVLPEAVLRDSDGYMHVDYRKVYA